MEEIYQTYKADAQFFLIYIREAHPDDGWQMAINEQQGIVYNEPVSADERTEIASACVLDLELTIPTLIDNMENSTDSAYLGKPDRLYVVDIDSKIAFAGKRGPGGFKPDLMEEALQVLLAP